MKTLIELQRSFTQRLRHGAQEPLPENVTEKRMAIYESIVFETIEETLRANFPVLHSMLPEAHWEGLIRDYYTHYQAKSPYFYDISKQFLEHLQQEPSRWTRYPFVLELAHYEWVELALSFSSEEIDWPKADEMHAERRLYLSPLCWPLVYQFPVHQLSRENKPFKTPDEPTYLSVYRDRNDDIQFLELNFLSLRLLDIIR